MWEGGTQSRGARKLGIFFYKLLFLIIWGSFPNIQPTLLRPESPLTPRDKGSYQLAEELFRWSLRRWPLGQMTSGQAKEYGWDTNIVCYKHYLNLFVFTHFFWGGKIPEQAHLRLQRRFLFAALFLWSRSSHLGLWAAPGSSLEPSSSHRQLRCGPGGTDLWWWILASAAYASAPILKQSCSISKTVVCVSGIG